MHFIDTIILVQSDAGAKIGSFSLKLGSVVSSLFFLLYIRKKLGVNLFILPFTVMWAPSAGY